MLPRITRRSLWATYHPTRRWIQTSPPSRARRAGKFVAYTALGVSGVYLVDNTFYASSLTRSARTLYTGAVIALDYKLSFNAANADAIPQIHERAAERLFNCIIHNGGLYIKLGQAIAANAALLPPSFQTRFSKLFDDAPQIPYSDVQRVICREFGVANVGEIFADFEPEAVASASIAQVHRARLKDGGGEDGRGTLVAVKVQKPDVTQQVEWDLGAYKLLMWCYDRIFPLPIYFLADFIGSRLRLELDFVNEASNAKRTASYLSSSSSNPLLSTHSSLTTLAKRIYVPKVYDQYTTKHVMTAEWIDGVRLSDRRGLERLINGTVHDDSSILTAKTFLSDPWVVSSVLETSSLASDEQKSLNGKNWDGAGTSPSQSYWRDNNIPIKGGETAIMRSMIDLFCAQMFVFGFIHCDPHPGNIIVRRLVPSNESQLVVLDHALYVSLSPTFRSQYAHLWKSLLTLDWDGIKSVTQAWGVGAGAEDLFASGVLMRPVRRKSSEDEGEDFEPRKIDHYELAQKMKEKLANFLQDQEKWPKELVFIGRNMRIVQGNNQMFGSPVNRIRITAEWASRSLSYLRPPSPALGVQPQRPSFRHRLSSMYDHLIFLSILLSMDAAFYISKIRHYLRNLWTTGSFKPGGFEDEIEESMRGFARDNLGFEIGEGAFEG